MNKKLYSDRLVFQQKKIPYLNNEMDGKERGKGGMGRGKNTRSLSNEWFR